MARSKSRINILVEDRRWRRSIDFAEWSATVSKLPDLIARRLCTAGRCVINLLLTDDSGIRELNKAHRGKDEPTNVLSFPQYNADELEEICRISRKYDLIQLGDVVMSFDRIAQEAIEFHSYITERGAHMLVHGALHLIGMDHEKYLDAVDMEREEADILHSLDVWVPYFFNTNWAEHG